jgi:hypothetical protein
MNQLHQSFDLAFHHSRLPDHSNFDRADPFLIKARHAVVSSL